MKQSHQQSEKIVGVWNVFWYGVLFRAAANTTGKELASEAYRQVSYVNDVTRANEQVLVEYTTDGVLGNSATSYTYGVQRESYAMTRNAAAAGGVTEALISYSSGAYYYTGTGSVSNLISSGGSYAYTYAEYGARTVYRLDTNVAAISDTCESYGYNGEYTHETLGIQYLRARYYNMTTGTFTSKDTYAGRIESILSQNRYTYAENNPVNFADPSGHAKTKNRLPSLQDNIRVAKGGNGPALKPTVNNPTDAAKAAYQSRRDAAGTQIKNTLLDNIRISNGMKYFNNLVDRLPYEALILHITTITEVRRCQSYGYCLNETQENIKMDNNFNSTIVYAQPLAANNWLPVEQQIANAEYIYNYLLKEGWSKQAIYGMLGNVTNESYFNPGSSQQNTGNTEGRGNGYGIFQWDPPEDKFLRWLGTENAKDKINYLAETSPETLMNLQLEYFIISSTRPINPKDGSVRMDLEFYKGTKENSVNYSEYISLERNPREMAVIFCDSYERSNNGQEERQEWAEKWCKYFEEGYDIRQYYREKGLGE